MSDIQDWRETFAPHLAQVECPTCQGHGTILYILPHWTGDPQREQEFEDPCPSCSGAGSITRERWEQEDYYTEEAAERLLARELGQNDDPRCMTHQERSARGRAIELGVD